MRDEHAEPDERPTVPSVRPFDDGDGDGAGARDFGGAPTWPVARGSMGARGGGSATPRDVLPLALGVSLGVNVALLLGLAGVLFLARAGAFSSPRSSALSTPTMAATSTALGTPTPTTLASSGWLQVAPSSVQLGCDGDQQTQLVVLTNTGPQEVQWQAVLDASSSDQVGVEVAPNQGDLKAGASVVLQIHNRPSSNAQQGVIRFEFDSSDAGAGTAPSLSYTTMGCQ